VSAIWHLLDLVALVLEIALVVLAIRLYRLKRTRSFGWFMSASICFVVTSAFVWVFAAIEMLLGADPQSPQSATAHAVGKHTTYIFQWLTLICLVAAAVFFLRDHRTHDEPTI
jgi:hypothetical protein